MTAWIRLLSSHSLQVWSTTWMNSIWRWWESGNTSTLFIFLQYKTAVAPSIWYTRWKPMQNPPHFIVLTLTSGQKSSAAKSVNFYTHGAENRREELGKKRRKKKMSVFTLLWLFVRSMWRPWFGAGFLSWFLGCPGARSPGSFGCARWWRWSK